MTRRPPGRAVVSLVLTTVFVAFSSVACGGGGRPSMSAQASADLGSRVRQIRDAASAGDRAGAGAALAELRRSVAEHRGQGRIDDQRAARVLAAAADVEAGLALLPAPTTTTTTTTVPARRSPAATEEDEDHDEDKGKGKKKDD